MLFRKILVVIIPVVLSLNFLLMTTDATTEELNDTKNKDKDFLTIFNTLFSETGEKFSNSKYGVEIVFPKNWTGIEMKVVPIALVSPEGFNFTEMISTLGNATLDTVAENIVSDDANKLTPQKNQELAESISKNLTQKFENMTSTMGIFIHDKAIARLVSSFNANNTIPDDSLTSIFERLILASDPTTICERKTLERITINENISAEKSTQQCLFTNSGLKRNNLNYFILTPNAILGIILSSDPNNQNDKYLSEFEESLKSLSVKGSLPINNQSIKQFLNDDMGDDTDGSLNETAQNILNTFNGNELLSQGKYEDAISVYDARLSIDPKDVDALHNKGVALQYLGRYEEAISWYDKVLGLDPKYVNALYSKGTALQGLGMYEEAISWYDKAQKEDPKYVNALINKALALGDLDKNEEAISWYDKALEVDPRAADALSGKGIILGKIGSTEEAISWFDKALAVDPKNAGALGNKGVALNELGRHEESIAWFDKALEINPKDVNALTYKGVALGELGKPEEAIVLFEKALKVDPKFINALYNKASALSHLGKYEEAINSDDAVLDMDPKDVRALENKGIALYNLGKYEEANVVYDKALGVNPTDIYVLNNKGSALWKLGKSDEAIVWFDKALEVDPKNVDALIKKGAALLGLGKKQDALAWLDKALTIDPTNQIALDLKSLSEK